MIFSAPFVYSNYISLYNDGVVADYYGNAKADPWWCPGICLYCFNYRDEIQV